MKVKCRKKETERADHRSKNRKGRTAVEKQEYF